MSDRRGPVAPARWPLGPTDQPKGTTDMTDDQTNDRLVGLPAIAALVGVCVVTMRKMARDPAMGFPAKMVGGRWWASRRAVQAWCDQQLGGGAEHG